LLRPSATAFSASLVWRGPLTTLNTYRRARRRTHASSGTAADRVCPGSGNALIIERDELALYLKRTDPRTNQRTAPGGRAIVAGGLNRRSAGSRHCRPEGGRIARPPGRNRHENSVQRLQVPGYDHAPSGRIKRGPASKAVTLSHRRRFERSRVTTLPVVDRGGLCFGQSADTAHSSWILAFRPGFLGFNTRLNWPSRFVRKVSSLLPFARHPRVRPLRVASAGEAAPPHRNGGTTRKRTYDARGRVRPASTRTSRAHTYNPRAHVRAASARTSRERMYEPRAQSERGFAATGSVPIRIRTEPVVLGNHNGPALQGRWSPTHGRFLRPTGAGESTSVRQPRVPLRPPDRKHRVIRISDPRPHPGSKRNRGICDPPRNRSPRRGSRVRQHARSSSWQTNARCRRFPPCVTRGGYAWTTTHATRGTPASLRGTGAHVKESVPCPPIQPSLCGLTFRSSWRRQTPRGNPTPRAALHARSRPDNRCF